MSYPKSFVFGNNNNNNNNTSKPFSFGSNNASSWGCKQPTNAFGANTTPTTNAFGATTTPTTNAFGATTTPTTNAFGASTTPTTNAFGASTTPTTNAFGANTTPATFGAVDVNSNILSCLNECKEIQNTILNEIKHIKKTNNYCHKDIFCDNCKKTNIVGNRYKCIICQNYDLCEDCEANYTQHDPYHIFIKIKNTEMFNELVASNVSLFSA